MPSSIQSNLFPQNVAQTWETFSPSVAEVTSPDLCRNNLVPARIHQRSREIPLYQMVQLLNPRCMWGARKILQDLSCSRAIHQSMQIHTSSTSKLNYVSEKTSTPFALQDSACTKPHQTDPLSSPILVRHRWHQFCWIYCESLLNFCPHENSHRLCSTRWRKSNVSLYYT